jgi:hypothetical protein
MVALVHKCRLLAPRLAGLLRMAQIFNALSLIFSTVEHLTLAHEVHSQSSEGHDEIDRAEWRKLLRSV